MHIYVTYTKKPESTTGKYRVATTINEQEWGGRIVKFLQALDKEVRKRTGAPLQLEEEEHGGVKISCMVCRENQPRDVAILIKNRFRSRFGWEGTVHGMA